MLALEREAVRLIGEDQPVTSAFSDESRQARYWKIKAFEPVPCGGTHLISTREIGGFALKRKNVGKAKERIEIHLKD